MMRGVKGLFMHSRGGFVLLILCVAGGMGGCDPSSSSPAGAAGSARISVLATTYPMADMARRIGGTRVDVQWLSEGGQRPEAVEGTNELKVRANNAQLLITSGPWDDWAVRDLGVDARRNRVVEPGHTTVAGAANPRAYLWLDPTVVGEMAEAAEVDLTLIAPRHDAEFRENARTFIEEVHKVDAAYRSELEGLRGRKVLAVRPVWSALCARYGLTLLTPVEAREEELSAADCKELARVAKAEGLRTVFIDVSTPAGVRQRIEEQTGLKAVTLDAMGSSAADGRNTWASILRYDLKQLKAGLE
jgi:zinc transport system substrate-binding protein